MASICLSFFKILPPSLNSTSTPSSSCLQCSSFTKPMFMPCREAALFNGGLAGTSRRQSHLVRMAPDEEKLTRRNPLDFPIEWDRPKPGRRPDIFPQFSPMKTPLPPLPMPYDPPEEDEEEEKKEEEEEDPENEEQDKPDNK
ncbi:uncharacterized protein LOC124911869 [Impatiens glandulifera]|uniref:uncharacterized protein LOC124911869 n=1 Tax=Impatiens glandulifera TaxID=253017 RepID=UPI001FB05DE7|nr:uncharacterized protein LOC124911869 [Impatiens glandulifera]